MFEKIELPLLLTAATVNAIITVIAEPGQSFLQMDHEKSLKISKTDSTILISMHF